MPPDASTAAGIVASAGLPELAQFLQLSEFNNQPEPLGPYLCFRHVYIDVGEAERVLNLCQSY